MDGVEQDTEAVGRRVRGAIRERDAGLRVELGRGGDGDDEMSQERKLRRVAQAEHGEAAVARDEADGERAAGPHPAPTWGVHRVPGPGFVMRICCPVFGTTRTTRTSRTTRPREPAWNAG